MGKQIFQAYLSREDASSDASTRFDLPASPWQLLDALDKARCWDADSLYLEIDDYYDYEDLANILPTVDLSLMELNDLAQRLSSLDERQRTAFEGILRMEMLKGDEEITVQRLRDFTESVDCCHVVPETKKCGKIFCMISACFVPFPLHSICFLSLSKAAISTCSAPHCG